MQLLGDMARCFHASLARQNRDCCAPKWTRDTLALHFQGFCGRIDVLTVKRRRMHGLIPEYECSIQGFSDAWPGQIFCGQVGYHRKDKRASED